MELQQSAAYADYIRALKWEVLTVDTVRMFYRKFPFMGGLLKIQRPGKLPDIVPVIQKYGIRIVAIDPIEHQPLRPYRQWVKRVERYCRVQRSVYMPTKTILVDLTAPEDAIFRRFSEAKRRATRKAQKNGVVVRESQDFSQLLSIKNKSGGFLGFIATMGLDKFWATFAPKYATNVLAYKENRLVGGILVLFWHKTAYYWVAGASREGKKLFAPTLLVWEALRLAKARGAKDFDFLGVWDERKSGEHHDWKGFTRFKEGFGGRTIYYPVY